MLLPAPYQCDAPGCGAQRRDVNHWWAVIGTSPIGIYEWDDCKAETLAAAKHFCGVDCLMRYISSLVSRDSTNANRESTLELKPPLTRDGSMPSAERLGVV